MYGMDNCICINKTFQKFTEYILTDLVMLNTQFFRNFNIFYFDFHCVEYVNFL